MSFQGPHNQPNQFFGPALAGACIAVVLSVPAAALTAAVFGSTYKIRALIYCTFLLWAVIGAILVYLKTWKAEKQPHIHPVWMDLQVQSVHWRALL